MPFFVRNIIGNSMDLVPSYALNHLEKNISKYSKKNITKIANKFNKVSKGLKSSRNIDDLYLSLISEWDAPNGIVIDDVDTMQDLISEKTNFKAYQNDSLNMMYKDILSYLPDDILCKVDRASMASSLETRAPFLDHRVVEFALGMPIELKIRNNKGKWALREILNKYVPNEMVERPKTGFSIPIGDWLRGPLREWAEDLLDDDKIKSQGFLKPENVKSIWALHKSGEYDYTSRIWSILMFQSWLESNL
jgi:asparagine synthase (glutamine-hydrolysing)